MGQFKDYIVLVFIFESVQMTKGIAGHLDHFKALEEHSDKPQVHTAFTDSRKGQDRF